MSIAIVAVFVIGYILIALEHPLKIDKAASALLTGVFCWLVLLMGFDQMPAFQATAGETISEPAMHKILDESLFEHLGEIAGILFFLLGAMTIVELVDVHDGFRVITDRIATTDRVKLLWIISWVSFFLSSGLDNLTTTIIMCALIRRIVKNRDDVWLLGGFVVLAANAGGAWSPIGDVTTIMLWIGGQITTLNVMKSLFIPSVVSLLIPLLAATYFFRGHSDMPQPDKVYGEKMMTTLFERNSLFVLGGVGLVSVPFFKTVTHYPPYLGVLLSVGLLWYVTEFMHRSKEDEKKQGLSVASILHRIDTPSILFFLGILLAVGALDTSGHLRLMANTLDQSIGNIYFINILIGMLSAIVDNVPLVAAAMGMYPMTEFPPDHSFWNLLAYCAGTGGSILIIGSAAGVASMAVLKIDFIWYLKRISGYALLGYLAGVLVYYLMH
ncbi:sodium:proton antiporter NhaD [Larkinella punicea]|uniref:Sodium:proton antiporter n=1 Tax=Larkinella punicea TaxID=2315727 RepID=A0A368JSZ1_9BACT|nr:sodium:proton antiporter NhaD [Larkinella punicea]RCR70790.1 sodium:proton antiporter [Larkinella punicea]